MNRNTPKNKNYANKLRFRKEQGKGISVDQNFQIAFCPAERLQEEYGRG